jgi:hypothetical protein
MVTADTFGDDMVPMTTTLSFLELPVTPKQQEIVRVNLRCSEQLMILDSKPLKLKQVGNSLVLQSECS